MAEILTRVHDRAALLGRVAAVGLHVLGERLRPPPVLGANDVPASCARITPEWLTAVLCRQHPGAQVRALQVCGGSSGTSSRSALALELNDAAIAAGIPDRLFVKSTEKFTQRMMIGLPGCIAGEPGFYNDLRPLLDIEAPRGYHGSADAASWRSVVLMEDIVHTRGARFVSAEDAITRPHIEGVLDNMAAWHGRFWNSEALRAHRHLSTPRDFLGRLTRLIGMKERSALAAERHEALIPPALRGRIDDAWRALGRSFELNAELPATLLHGDCHIGQTYLTRNGRPGHTDWQIVMRGGWAYDFAYGLVSALTVDDRRAWERELLGHYLDRLHAAGGPAIPFETAWLLYRQHTLYPYFCWLYTIAGAGALQPQMQPPAICRRIVERTAHAIADLESLAALAA